MYHKKTFREAYTYFNHSEDRLYTTTRGGSMLYEVFLNTGRDGVSRIARVEPIDTGGNQIGKDIY